ncbi:NADPH quinone oxidoreductase [Alkalilimnicola ehrlichii]|uniref:NADPH quinone oxidoreductase n=1 Tax=Alkalilimnicola ehrlichii TaxID=351052 RepID=A0A3E0WV16_9GAMM|nr:NAD(P)H-dependent oxidoreductase [Alkalilimnicola ehrlichii]RFA29311.1 NADPH quinone oxidoreductase [Alkalilimnicola ehrlichii]RFA36824.1 NADPH quinone oxidoreductase [Alkalilimnicola ehrlichii]
MNVLIVLAHPERQSFNGGLTDLAVETLRGTGHDVEVDDLYAEGFDPVERASHYPQRANSDYFSPLTEQRAHYERKRLPPDVAREIGRLEWADLLILQFPLWWHAQPAILKGWFDRVLVYGGLYSGSKRYNRGHFRGKRAICSVTAGSPAHTFMPFGRAGNMVEWLWPIHSSLYYVGYEVLAPQVSYEVQSGGVQYREETAFRENLAAMKQAWSRRIPSLAQESGIPFTSWEDWDNDGVLRATNPMRWRPS